MAARKKADRSTVTRSKLMYLGPEETPELDRRYTSRAICAAYAGRREWIGWLVHRAYDSGYPQPWEVVKGGARTWAWCATEQEAQAAAAEYVAAYVQAIRASGGYVDLDALHGPAQEWQEARERGELDAYERAAAAVAVGGAQALAGERAAVAREIAGLLGAYTVDDVHGLRAALEELVHRLVRDAR